MRNLFSFSVLRFSITLLAALACVAMTPAVVRAVDTAWIGGPTGNWTTASNWSAGVPNNTQAASYLATVANSLTQYTQVTMNLPSVELTQLKIRNISTVIVPTSSVLRLRDTGAGTSLVRSFSSDTGPNAGGVLQLNGGQLNIAINGGVISGNAAIRLANGRVGGFGRIENSRFNTGGYGTIGNAAGQSDSGLTVYNIGSGNPSLVRIMADGGAGKTLTIGPAGDSGSIGILNDRATLGATLGGTIVLRGNGTTIENQQGRVFADANSEVHLAANAILSNANGTIDGTGTLRVPTSETATIDNWSAGQLLVSTLAVDGTLNLKGVHTNTKNIDVSGRLVGTATGANFANGTGGALRLQPPATGTPMVDLTGRIFLNNGTISGGGEVLASRIDNYGTLASTSSTKPLYLNSSATLMSGSTLNAASGPMIVGKATGVGGVTASTGALIEVRSGAALEFNVPMNATSYQSNVITNNGTLTFRGTTNSNVGMIDGGGALNVLGPMTVGVLHAGAVQVESALTFRPATGTSRSTSLTVSGAGDVNLESNPYIVDYASGTPSPLQSLRTAIAGGKIHGAGVNGYVVGYGEASAIGSPPRWNGELVDGSAILLLATRPGDFNLDRSVNFTDLVKLAQNYNRTADLLWTDGDANHDGKVNFTDLVALAQNYDSAASASNAGMSMTFAEDWARAQALVPEPSVIIVFAVTPFMMRRRQRPARMSR